MLYVVMLLKVSLLQLQLKDLQKQLDMQQRDKAAVAKALDEARANINKLQQQVSDAD
jgi:hypothetical protein